MSVAVQVALGYALLRGVMLTAGTVPWALGKLRRAEAGESERSLLWMVASRTILLGLALVALWVTKRREALAWALFGDGALQVFDALAALRLRKRALALMPAALALLDGCAGLALLAYASA